MQARRLAFAPGLYRPGLYRLSTFFRGGQKSSRAKA